MRSIGRIMMACAHHSNACDFKNLEKKKTADEPFYSVEIGNLYEWNK